MWIVCQRLGLQDGSTQSQQMVPVWTFLDAKLIPIDWLANENYMHPKHSQTTIHVN